MYEYKITFFSFEQHIDHLKKGRQTSAHTVTYRNDITQWKNNEEQDNTFHSNLKHFQDFNFTNIQDNSCIRFSNFFFIRYQAFKIHAFINLTDFSAFH